MGNKQWDIPALRELLLNILWHKSKLENFEISHNFPNIGERIVLLNARELVNETGGEKLILLAIADITEQITARKKVEESEQRFRLATETSGVGIWEWNVINNQIKWDAKMFEIYGVKPTIDGLVQYNT